MMKVLCDVHIARKVVRFFQQNGVEATHVNDILDSWYTSDKAIADYADEHKLVVLSKDRDFRNSHHLKKSPRRLLLISLGNISTANLIAILGKNLALLREKFEAEECFVELQQDAIVIISRS
ncbi:MAG: DUF5615 family PIN-like protein [Lewinella sp.]|nr:DUF5615 family PIN-like protein [Lewinella sp.]